MKAELEIIIGMKEANVLKLKTRLMENYTYQLSWIGEDLFMEQYKLEHYKAILEDVVKLGEQESMSYWLERFNGHINQDYNVRENSTGSLHREVSTWKFIATMQMLKELKQIIKHSNK
jgi:hypothetical protein